MFNLSKEQEERAMRLHRESVVVDTMAGAGVAASAEYTPKMSAKVTDLVNGGASTGVIHQEVERLHAEDLISGESDIEREWMELSGVDVFHMTVATQSLPPFEGAMTGIALWQRKIDSLDYLAKVTSFKDIERAKAQGKRAIIMGFQDSKITVDYPC